MTPDPYAPYLRQADDLSAQGDLVKAGQIWQAILKQQPAHVEARERLMDLKQRLLALRAAEETAAGLPAPPAQPESEPKAPPAPQIAVPAPMPAPPPPPVTLKAAPEAAPAPPFEASRTAPEAPLQLEQDRVITGGGLDPERLVAEGCTLYDMGQVEDALKKWEGALTLDPAHALARGYANGARLELGLTPLQGAAAPAPAQEAAPEGKEEEDVDKLMREAVQLYDMGLTEEAITKWERVLALEPHRQEVEGYLRQARAEASLSASGPTLTAPAPAPTSGAEALDLKLRQAEHLLTLQRHEEAAFTFQQALGLSPGNARALQGLERCRKPARPGAATQETRQAPAPVVTFDAQGRIAMADEETLHLEPQGVEPPAALLQAAPPPRKGLSLPDRFSGLVEQMPWLKDTKILAILGGSALLFILALSLLHSYRKDQALKEEVRAARAAAVAPVAQQAQAPDVTEPPDSIRQEAEGALVVDPLRAYLRAETLLSRQSGDPFAAQLLEKAREGLAGGVTGASLPEFQKHLQNGDLEAAHKVLDALLRAHPEDMDLRARAARLHLGLCLAHASQAKWEEAQEDLLRGRALFPNDKSWSVRLRLLERIKAMPKEQRPAWISLLG